MPGSPLDGTFEVDLSASAEDIPAAVQVPPSRHQRTSSFVEASSSNGSQGGSFNGSICGPAEGSLTDNNSSSSGVNGNVTHSCSGKMRQQQLPQQPPTDHAGIDLDIPDFACMLPAECSFSESVADEAVDAPTPHTPVVLPLFEGQGLEVCTLQQQQAARHTF
jgi:hypothetical protein